MFPIPLLTQKCGLPTHLSSLLIRKHLLVGLKTRKPNCHLRNNPRNHSTQSLVQSQGCFFLDDFRSGFDEASLLCSWCSCSPGELHSYFDGILVPLLELSSGIHSGGSSGTKWVACKCFHHTCCSSSCDALLACAPESEIEKRLAKWAYRSNSWQPKLASCHLNLQHSSQTS